MTLDIQSENIFTLVNKQILNHLRYFEKNIYWNDSWQSRLKQPAWSNLGFSVTAVCLLLSYFRILIVKKNFFLQTIVNYLSRDSRVGFLGYQPCSYFRDTEDLAITKFGIYNQSEEMIDPIKIEFFWDLEWLCYEVATL